MSKVLVIGGGVSGMAAARSLSSLGITVELVERSGSLGGRVSRLAALFPDLRPPGAMVGEMAGEVALDHNISLHLGAELLSVERQGKGFRAELSDSASVDADAIIVATGLELVPAALVPEYGYGEKAGVVTSLELEGFLVKGSVPGNVEPVRRVVIVQCVGSRTERKGVPYCSAVCCANAIKDAVLIKRIDPSIEVTVLYIDIRTTGKGQESLYREARRRGVRFIRGQPALVTIKGVSLLVCGENTLLRELYELPADLVVLSCGLRQSPENLYLLDLLGVNQTMVGFPDTSDGCATSQDGIFVAGSAEGPREVPAALAHARACALVVAQYLKKK